jgi:SAM-dependent methyltransferase
VSNHAQEPGAVHRVAQDHWSQDPAGSVALLDEQLGTPESFARIEQHRYMEQPWMRNAFRFETFAGRQVLEVGVGLGTDHLQFARAGAIMTGVDLTPRCVELTSLRLTQEGLVPNIRVMDAEDLDFGSDTFDAAYSFGVLHHVPSPGRAFAEIRRVLRPGGTFIGAVYNRWSVATAAIATDWIVTGQWRRESFAERLARVEHSEGSADPGPYVKLFSARELDAALRAAGFTEVTIAKRHFGIRRLARHLPETVVEQLGQRAGWYLIHRAS